MNKAQTDGLLRHILTLVAGFAVGLGLISEEIANDAIANVTAICGGVLGLIAIYKSVTAKSKAPAGSGL